MKKPAIITIVVVALLAIGGGVYYLTTKQDDAKTSTTSNNQTADTNTTEQTTTKQATTKELETAKDATDKLTAKGLALENQDIPYYQMVGAKDGVQGDIGGTAVELYQFTSTSEADKVIEQLSDADNTTFRVGKLTVLIHSTDSTIVTPIKEALEQ